MWPQMKLKQLLRIFLELLFNKKLSSSDYFLGSYRRSNLEVKKGQIEVNQLIIVKKQPELSFKKYEFIRLFLGSYRRSNLEVKKGQIEVNQLIIEKKKTVRDSIAAVNTHSNVLSI